MTDREKLLAAVAALCPPAVRLDSANMSDSALALAAITACGIDPQTYKSGNGWTVATRSDTYIIGFALGLCDPLPARHRADAGGGRVVVRMDEPAGDDDAVRAVLESREDVLERQDAEGPLTPYEKFKVSQVLRGVPADERDAARERAEQVVRHGRTLIRRRLDAAAKRSATTPRVDVESARAAYLDRQQNGWRKK